MSIKDLAKKIIKETNSNSKIVSIKVPKDLQFQVKKDGNSSKLKNL